MCSFIQFAFKNWELAQSVKGLLHRHKNLNSDPQHPCRKSGMAAHTSNPSSMETKTDIPDVCWPVSLTKSVSDMFKERP